MDERLPDVVVVPGGNAGPYTGNGTNAYLLPGPEPVLIDTATGMPAFLDRLAAVLSERCWSGRPHSPLRVLVTHAHGDHIGGCQVISDAWPDTEFLKMPWPERDRTAGVEFSPLAHGDIVSAGPYRLRAMHTPGHAPDHLCFLEEASRTLFSGDLVVEDGTVLIPASDGGSLEQYLASLRSVLATGPARLLPAHGRPVERPGEVIGRYLAHRMQRERQIVAVLVAGDATPDEIVRAVYPALAPALAGAARESVMAHLVKLERERCVAHANGRWRLVEGQGGGHRHGRSAR